MAVSEPGRVSAPTWRSELLARIEERDAQVGVVGLGYVGLPLLLTIRQAGFPVTGLDVDAARVKGIREGTSYVTDVTAEDLATLDGQSRVTTRYAALGRCNIILICVPTPLRNHEPDLGPIESAARGIARHLRPGTLVVLESTTYPGTTEEVVRPLLEASGLVAGKDFALAYAPERIDPGQELQHISKTPRVVGGLTEGCTQVAAAFYGSVVERVHTVPSPRDAEMSKLIENVFRHVNIALVNQLAIVSRDLGVNIWEAIEAAATKPFGYMPFWPGPGVGGHCIAIDPSYLSWRVGQRLGHRMSFVELAQEVNAQMPAYVASRIADALNEHGKAVKGAKILGIGVAYKPDVNDARESPALAVLERLARAGAVVAYHDPHVPNAAIAGHRLGSTPLSREALTETDCVVILTAHRDVDYSMLLQCAQIVVDTRGSSAGLRGLATVIRL